VHSGSSSDPTASAICAVCISFITDRSPLASLAVHDATRHMLNCHAIRSKPQTSANLVGEARACGQKKGKIETRTRTDRARAHKPHGHCTDLRLRSQLILYEVDACCGRA
jgi:hypothetical protein